MKHLPFKSIYRDNFEVVEQRQGRLSLYPHTEQLPILWRALDMEFRDALPGRVARVDQRADGFQKLIRRTSALIFCAGINGARADNVRLYALPTPDLVCQVAVVQQITEDHRLGRCHWFRFYAGEHFQPEVRLSGKRVVFSDHVLQRFSTRVPNNVGEDMTFLLMAMFGSPMVSLRVGPGRAFVVSMGPSVVAFTYKESEHEFFITTCLTVREMSSMQVELPPLTYNWHYGASFTRPKIRNWVPTVMVKQLYEAWLHKTPLSAPKNISRKPRWHGTASLIKDILVREGHGPGSKIVFQDDIPAPTVLECRPGYVEFRHDEMAEYKRAHPETEWDEIFADRNRRFGEVPHEAELQP